MDGTEHINDTFAASLKTFYDQFKDMSTDTGGFGQPMVLWNATLDTTKVVDEIRVNKQVRTQRHRAPGRGV
jgi:hypothetical protein